MDPVLLARIQFGFTISFHIIFPSFTIGLAAYIATLLAMWVRTGSERYQLLARFWTKIFAVSFAMGVVSGLVLSYQFGTNWSRFSVVTGNVIGPAIGYEVLTAFFLEATFLGVLLFGFGRVPPWLSVLAAAVIAAGTAMSAFWIISANSWMHTPTGHEVRDGIAYPVDWLAIIFNPSFPYRLAHMVTAAYLTTAFVVLAVGARYLLAGKHEEHGRTMVLMAVGMIAVVARHSVHRALVLVARIASLVDRLRRGDLRLDRHRDRTPALDRLRHPAHRRCDLADLGVKRRRHAGAVRSRLRHRVRDGHLLHQPPDREGPAGQPDRGAAWPFARQPALIGERCHA